jgi:GAF domain-containing protein/HAMP domain-containing protein
VTRISKTMNNRLDNPLRSTRSPRRTSLRTNLILGNMLIIFLAVIGMGFYVYYRAQQANEYLTTQLDESVYQQAEAQLNTTSDEQALLLNDFFSVIRRDITNLGHTLGGLLSVKTTGPSSYWDANQKLSRLTTGSWDNPNDEPASIFIPAAVDLTPELVQELNASRQIDFVVPPLLESNPDVVAIYFGGSFGDTVYYPNIDLAAIVPADFDVTSRPWYVNATPVQDPSRQAVWSDPYLDAALNGLVITSSTPIYDENGSFRGVTAMDIQLNHITEIVTNIQVGDTGYAFLIDRSKRLIAMPAAGYQDLGIPPETLALGDILDQDKVSTLVSARFWNLLSSMASGGNGLELVEIGGTDRFMIYQQIPEIGYSLAIIVPSDELLADAIAANQQIAQVTQDTILVSLLLVAVILVISLLATLGIGNRLTRPLASLTRVAEDISQGNLSSEAKVNTRDEFGTLAGAFNAMTARLRDMIANLEKRVSERTSDLERRASQIQAVAEVGNAATSMRNLDELLTRVTNLISQRFDFYHVGIFLMDTREEYALLVASNSPGGQKMLARNHKLRVGQVGIVGYVTSTGNARIALDVGEDAVFFDNPDLPETRSEMALPLTIGHRIIGALDVQSTRENAFTEDDIQTLRLLADQVAIAIDNARLLTESQKAIETTRRAYGDIVRSSWDDLFKQREFSGVSVLSKGQVVPALEEAAPEFTRTVKSAKPQLSDDGRNLFIPISVLGNVIGALRLGQKADRKWTSDDIQTATTLSDQLGAALESARLYEQISDRARREALITDITTKIGSSVEIDTIMQTTVEEIGRIFKGSDVVLQLKKESSK